MQKSELRKMTRARVKALTECNRADKSSALCRDIVSFVEQHKAHTVALFASLPDEAQTDEAIAALSTCCRIVLPRIEGDEMAFYDYDEGLQRGSYNIMEPVAATPIHPAEIELMFLPGVAFTREGARLGRGKGYYDRYLAHPDFRATTVGVCYAEQLVDTLPLEPHDRPCDAVLAR